MRRPVRIWRRRFLPGLVLVCLCGAVLTVSVMALSPPRLPADRAVALPPGAGPVRIVVLGTSLTASSAWPAALQTRLTRCLGRAVTVVPVARNGVGSLWALGQTGRVIAARPDLVMIEFAINDADILDGVRMSASRATHATLLDTLARDLPDARIMLITTNPVTGLIRHLQRPGLALYYAMLRDLAVHRGIGLADLAPRWQAAFAARPDLRPQDGLHPGPAATELVLLPALTGLLGRESPSCRGGDGP